uniref:Uncharacterized protein n=1 Tax=Tanacetum cinerariifolium TaxID=118510 RepID=A0A699UDC7_TANCI|nr:hypothetical protein [Tanacetum cinerariifolium]
MSVEMAQSSPRMRRMACTRSSYQGRSGHKLAGFLHNAVGIAAALAPAGERHHAEGAHIIAAAHDADEGRDAVRIQAHRGDIGVGFLAAQ